MATKKLVNLFFLFTLCFIFSKNTFSKEIHKSAVREFIQALMKCKKINGLSLSMVKGDITVLEEGYGFKDLHQTVPVTEETLFNIGSLTKAFTATVAADAVARGKVKWDDPLKKIFGQNFKLQDEFRTSFANLKDLLSHRYGIPGYYGVTTAAPNITRHDLIRLMQYFPIKESFRTDFLYSNYLYVMAAVAVETVTGETWEDAITERIFSRLGMNQSVIASRMSESDWNRSTLSFSDEQGHFVENNDKLLIPIINGIAPAGAIFSNAVDMGTWLKFHLSGGKNAQGVQLISKKVLEDTYDAITPSSSMHPIISKPAFPVSDLTADYGMGWFIGNYRGYEKTDHPGLYSGYHCDVKMLPEKKIGVWTCANSPGHVIDDDDVQLVTMFGLDLLLGETPWLNTTTACTFPEPWLPPLPEPPAPTTRQSNNGVKPASLNQYVGNYVHKAFGTFRVFRNDAEDYLRYSYGRFLNGKLLPGGEPDQFQQTLEAPLSERMSEFPDGITVNFERTSGHVSSVIIPYMEYTFPPVFNKI